MKVKISFTDGREVVAFTHDTLILADKTRKISLVFDTAQVFSGFLDEIDDEFIHLTKPDAVAGIALPMNRLFAWFYDE